MPRLTRQERFDQVHQTAMKVFDTIQATVEDERTQCIEDRRFYSVAGAQWEGAVGDQFQNKPQFEVNKIHLSVIRIINEYRNNRITVNFTSKDGIEDDRLADVCDGLYRANEQDSGADEAYDNAFEEACAGGFGAWRLRTEYEDEYDPENENQKICIEPIFDADKSVFFDLTAKRQDKGDAKQCFVISSMDRDTYEEEYGDDPDNWDTTIGHEHFDWATPDLVFIAEYYVVEDQSYKLHIWQHLDQSEEQIPEDELTEDREAILDASGSKEVRIRRIKRRKVRKYILSGGGVLEDCGVIAGDQIPIVPVYGKRWYVDDVERCMGHVRLSKDIQRLKNMQLSKLGEISAISATEKPIFTPEQVAGHAEMWENDNIENYPYMLVNPITDAGGNTVPSGPIGYTKAPQIPPAMAALLQITEEDMKDLLGNQQAGEEIVGNVAQGTVEMIQNRLDMQTYIYMSNMAKAMKRCGEIWLGIIRDIMVEEGRTVKTVGKDGELGQEELLKPVVDSETDEITQENDLSKARFDVNVDVGPSSSTKRAATVRSLTNMLQVTDPNDLETRQVLSSMIMMNMDGEGISEVRDYFRQKLIRMNVVKPTEQEREVLAKEAENQQPSANDEYLKAAAENQLTQAAENAASTVLKEAQAKNTDAKTAQILSEIPGSGTSTQ